MYNILSQISIQNLKITEGSCNLVFPDINTNNQKPYSFFFF